MPRRSKQIPMMRRPLQMTQGCGEKRRYHTQLDATRAAELSMLQQPGLELDVYLCPSCRGWHLTRRIGPEKLI